MAGQLFAFVGVSIAVICTPGPDTVLTVRNALAGGWRGGVWTAAGVALGQAVWTVAAGFGVAGLVQASEPAFLTLKYLGAAYLFYLGVQSLRAAWRGGGSSDVVAAALGPATWRALRQGLLNNLANPKMAAFFMSLLPQFAPGGRGTLPTMLALGLLFCLLTFAWLALYSVAIDRSRAWFARSSVRRWLGALSGCLLVGFGFRIVLSGR